MILGVGIDIVNTARIGALFNKFGKKFEEKIFTKNEIASAKKFKRTKNNPYPEIKYYAKRFAAKEAFSKAVGIGIGKEINFIDIEIKNDKNGKPEINLSKKTKSFICEYFKIKSFAIHVSLSDEEPISQAIVILSEV
jgi:holo-[acyl-carrier protein] synthase